MNIDISKNEYKTLIEMLYIAEWIINAHKVEPDPSTLKYSDLEQKFLSLAKVFGLSQLAEYDPEKRKYYTTRLLDEGPAQSHIEEYDDETFWEELIDRLMERDMFREYGEEKIRKMTMEERWANQDPMMEKYSNEFENNGLDNLLIKPI